GGWHRAGGREEGGLRRGRPELGGGALGGGAPAAGERWLPRPRDSPTDPGRPPLQVLEQALALTAYLQVGEATDDDKGGEPDGSDESSRNAHAAPRWPAA